MKSKRKQLGFLAIIALLLLAGVLVFVTINNLSLSEEKARRYIDADWAESLVSHEDQPQYLKQLSQQTSYMINSIVEEEGYYIISVTVLAPDLKSYFIDNSVHLLENIEDLDMFVCDCIEKSNYSETEAEIYIYEVNSEMKVSYTDTFVDAMYGGIISYSQEMLRELYTDCFDGGLE